MRVRGDLGLLVGLVVSGLAVTACTAPLGGPPPGLSAAQPSAADVVLSAAGDPVPALGAVQSVGPQGATLQFPGVTVSVPAGAVPEGQAVQAATGASVVQVARGSSSETFGVPVQVQLSTPFNKPVRVSWDVSQVSAEQRAGLVLLRWDRSLGVWGVLPAQGGLEGDRLSADLSDSSIVSWGFGTAASVSETLLRWSARQTGAPTCAKQGSPAWVTKVGRPDADQAATTLRTCAEQDQKGALTLRAASNSPVTQALELTAGASTYAWVSAGEPEATVGGIVRTRVNALLPTPQAVILGRDRPVAVGLARPAKAGGVQLSVTSRPAVVTVGEDALVALLESVVGGDAVDGFDAKAFDTLAGAVFDCGGSPALRSLDVVTADTFASVLDTVHACATNGSVAAALEGVVRTEAAKGGAAASQAAQTHRRLVECLNKLGSWLKVADWATYTAALREGFAAGPPRIEVTGTGTPPALGSWKASCTEAAADSSALSKNLLQQDPYAARQAEELVKLPSWRTDAAQAIKPLLQCGTAHNEGVAQNVATTWRGREASAVVAQLIREAAASAAGVDVTPADLRTAAVPADCENVPAQRLVDGESKGDPGQGWLRDTHVAVDLAGLGYKQQLAGYGCTAGGVGWPEWLILIGQGGRLLASFNLGEIGKQEHASVTAMSASGNSALVTWDSYEGAGFDVHSHRSRVTYSNGRLVVAPAD